jgi:hypothetical protein
MTILIKKLLWSLCSLVLIFSISSCEKEALSETSSQEESTALTFRTGPDFLYAVTEYDPISGRSSMIYEIDRASGKPTGFRTSVYFNGLTVTDIIGICRTQHIGFNDGEPFYAVTLGPNSNVPQNPSVVFGIPDIYSGEIMFEFNDNDTAAGIGTHIKDIEWSDWGGLGLIGIENTPVGGVHYLVDFVTPHNVVRYEILGVPGTEEVRGLSWANYQNTANFNCPVPAAHPIHHFDALDVTNGGTSPVPAAGLHTLYLTTLDPGGMAKLYSLVFDWANQGVNAYFVQQLDPGAGVAIAQSQLALGWDYANHNMYVGGDQMEEYSHDPLNTCPSEPWDLKNSSGVHNWINSIADFTSQPFGF